MKDHGRQSCGPRDPVIDGSAAGPRSSRNFPRLSDYEQLAQRIARPARDPAPMVSVITICRNAADTIGRCIASARAQDFQDYEHIVIDAKSTDGTSELASRALRPCDFVLSEPDRGISDAMNKGVALSRGRFIQFLHADDWMTRGQLATSVKLLDVHDASFVFGDLIYFVGGKPDFLFRGDPDYADAIDSRMPALNHPTVLARREVFEQIGLFSLQYRCAMDYDWFLRLDRAGGRGIYCPEILGCMNHDGVSNTQYRQTMKEVQRISVSHGRNPLLAQGEFLARVNKTLVGRMVRVVSSPAYRYIRRCINPSFGLIDQKALARACH